MPRALPLLLLLLLFLAGCDAAEEPIDETPGPAVLPLPTGPFAVGTTTRFLVDEERGEPYTANPDDKRELMVQFWYPAEAGAGKAAPYMEEDIYTLFAAGQDYVAPDTFIDFVSQLSTNARPEAPLAAATPLPVLFFSHGLGGARSIYTTFAEELASHGYLIVAIDHTFDAFATRFPDGRVQFFAFRDAEELRTGLPQIAALWADDMRFVLDVLETLNAADPGGLFTGRLDLNRVGAAGHSAGGSSAAEALAHDARFRAGASLDAPQVGEVLTLGLDQPFLLFFEDDSEYFKTQLQQGLRAGGFEVTVANTEHTSFTDVPVLLKLGDVPAAQAAASTRPPGTIDPDRNLEIITAYLLAFFDEHLRGQPSALLNGGGNLYPEVTAAPIGPSAVPPPAGPHLAPPAPAPLFVR